MQKLIIGMKKSTSEYSTIQLFRMWADGADGWDYFVLEKDRSFIKFLINVNTTKTSIDKILENSKDKRGNTKIYFIEQLETTKIVWGQN